MKRCISNLVALGVFCGSILGSGTGVAAQAPGLDVVGQWDPILDWPLEAIHMIALKNGKVLCVYDRQSGTDKFMLFDPDPAPGENPVTVITTVPTVPGSDPPLPIILFCSGQTAGHTHRGTLVFIRRHGDRREKGVR